MIKVLYLVSIIALYIFAILIKKKEDKMDIIPTIFVGIILLACYNIICSLILKIINIPIEILPLTIINIIVMIPILYKIIKDKDVQKYYIEYKDVLAIILISIVGLIVVYVNFGLPMNISFVEEDISNHYSMITSFYKKGDIKIADLFGVYVNYGIFFKIFFNPLNRFDGYYLFMICEIIKFIFSGVLLYITIKQFSKNKVSYILGILISIIYMIAYPLHGMLCGFVYLQLAINIVCAILIIMSYYKKINNELKNFLLLLLMCGLVFNYYFLAPPIAMAIALFELKGFENNKRNTIINILEILAIPTILGILFYFVIPYTVYSNSVYDPASHITKRVSQVGYIFVSYYATYLFFLPFCIYNVVDNIRKKNIDFFSIAFIANLLYNIIMVIAQINGKIARYYVMKPFYMIWLIMIATTGKVVLELLSSKIEKTYRVLVSIVISLYVVGIFYSVLVKGPCDIKIFEHEKEGLQSIFNIYRVNYGIITHQSFEIVYTAEEFKFLKEQTKEFSSDTNIVFVEDVMNVGWVKNLLLIKNSKNKNTRMAPINDENAQNKLIEEIKESNEKIYIICTEDEFIKEYFSEFIQKLDNTFNKVENMQRVTIYTNH